MKKLTFLTFFALALFALNSQAQINTFPHTEDFESFSNCTTGCGATCVLSAGWSNSLTDDLDWLTDENGTGSSPTGPPADHTTGTSSGHYLYVETSCGGTGFPNKIADLWTETIDLSAHASAQLEFWYHMYGASMGNLQVDVSTNGGGAWTNEMAPITDNQDLWQMATVDLSAYDGDVIIVRFRYVSGTNYYGDAAIDDVTITATVGAPPIIACPADVMENNDSGVCGATVVFADALAIDPEDGPIPTTQTMGPPSGSVFPVGDTIIEFSATDSDGNTVSCQFTITIVDAEDPVAVCQDITVELDANGEYLLDPIEVVASSSDNCGVASIEILDSFVPAGLYSIGWWDGVLSRFDYDPVTDAITLVDNPYGSVPIVTYSIDINPIDNQAYVLADSPNTGNRALLEYDLSTATTGTDLGDVVSSSGATNPNSMTFAPNGTLYIHFGNGDLDTFDIGTMTGSSLATGLPTGGNGLTFDYDNNVVLQTSGTGPVTLTSIDLGGTVTTMFSFSGGVGCSDTAQALEYVGNNKLVASGTFGCDAIYTVDTVTQVVNDILSPSGVGNGKSMFYLASPILNIIPDLLLTCADVGDVLVEVVIIDDSGNTSNCTATVTVEDNTAPVIACIGEPSTSDIMSNGSFESGDFTDWTVVDFAAPFIPYGVGPLAPGVPFFPDALPTDGGFLAFNGFDGGGPDESILYQEVTIPVGVVDVTLTWDENIDYDLSTFCVGCSDRIYEVQVRDLGGNVLEVLQQVVALANVIDDDNVWDSLSADLSAYAGQTIRIAYWQTIPDSFSGPAKFGLDNVSLNVTTTGTPLDVVLDATGNITVNASALLMSNTDNCGVVTTTVPGTGAPQSLTTTFAGGNGHAGNMFDIMAINEITVESFDVNMDTGTTDDVEVWFKTGTFVGSETNPGDWTLLDTAVGVASLGVGVPTPLNMSLGQVVPAGDTVAFYVTLTTTTNINYTNGTTLGALFASDANLEFYEGNGGAYFDVNFSPRVFNGNIIYTAVGGTSATIDFDCSNLGENLVEVTSTDAAGNSSTCTATVNVLDETAPIITCVGPTIPTEMVTVSETVGLPIPDNDPVGLSSTITVTDSFPLTDLNVDVDITHTWVGDLTITLESPAGTTALIFDGPTDGCNGDDMAITFDDESANSLSCEPGPPAFPLADYIPSNALDVFDGEDTVGDWILTVADNVGADTGTLNSWGFTYSYDGTPTLAYPIFLDENGEATIDPMDLIATVDEACGISTSAADITEFDCSDVGTGIILVTVFVSDASGNIAACVAEVEVFDNLGPELTCPPDETVDPGPGNLFWVLEDYWALGLATAIDNCTDPVTITTQDPPPGTLLPDGVHTITITAEDEWGNVSTCTFELTVESVLGLEDNVLDNAIVMYPNPARNLVTISNSSSILLDSAMIFDVSGKLVSQIDLSDMQGEKVIDVSEFASGVYMVQITGEESSIVKRLIKE